MREVTIIKHVGKFDELNDELQRKVINKFRDQFDMFDPSFVIIYFVGYMKDCGVEVLEENVHSSCFSGRIIDMEKFIPNLYQHRNKFSSDKEFNDFIRWFHFVNTECNHDVWVKEYRNFSDVYVNADIELVSIDTYVKKACEEQEKRFFSILEKILTEHACEINDELSKAMQTEWEYSHSDECVKDLIINNDYEFDLANGEMFLY